MTWTAEIIGFAARPPKLENAARNAAQHFLADTLAVGAAGAAGREAQKLSRTLPIESGTSRLLGTQRRADAQTAAMWNGFAIHCLEWDAVHEPAVVHAMSVVTATLLALIDEAGGVPQDEALTALAVGVDIASGIGQAATGAMRFFRPATAGVLGAALAGARIAGLQEDRLADALGLAYSQAAGTMQAHVEASVALPLQVGLSARAAVTAVQLARAGLGGPHDVLEGQFGYSALIEDLDPSRYRPGERWLVDEVSIKPFPSGRASHGILGEIEPLVADGTLSLGNVARAEAFVPPLIHRLVGRPYDPDMSEGYARLCLAFLLSLMLRDGHVDPRKMDEATIRDPAIAALAQDIAVTLDGTDNPNAMAPQRLVLELKGGLRTERTIAANLGSPAAPMSARQQQAKHDLAQDCAGPDADPQIFTDPTAYFCGRTP